MVYCPVVVGRRRSTHGRLDDVWEGAEEEKEGI